MLTPLEIKLIKALRSGRYKQTRNQLISCHNRNRVRYCCLGVACKISRLGKFKDYNFVETKGGSYDFIKLTTRVRDRLRWFTSSGKSYITDRAGYPQTLAMLNDDGVTFEQIADIIQAELIQKIDDDV